MYECSRDMYITPFFWLEVEAGFYSHMVEYLPLNTVAQISEFTVYFF